MSPRLALAKPLTASGVNSPGKRGKKKGDPTRVAFLFFIGVIRLDAA